MTSEQAKRTLIANVGRRMRVTFEDEIVQTVEISSVDDEGFVHSGPDGAEPDGYWTRFERVLSIDPPTQEQQAPRRPADADVGATPNH